MDGGSLKHIWRALEEERAIAAKYGIKFNHGKMRLYLLAGEFFNSDNAEGGDKHRENFQMLQNFQCH